MDKNIEKELSSYLKIMLNKKLSRSKVAMEIPAAKKNDINSLWEEHEHLRAYLNEKYHKSTFNKVKQPDFSYLDLKVKIAEIIFENCYFCEKKCYVDRNTKKGYCNVLKPKIASEFVHMGEEAPLVPSHTIFFTGCNFKCIYCQNFDISQFPDSGIEIE